jgi:hypothetical protein
MIETSGFFCLTGICHRNRIEVKNLKNSYPFFVHVGLNRPKKTKRFFSQKVPQFLRKAFFLRNKIEENILLDLV